MSTNPFTHFVLVDFENRPDIDLGLIAGHPVKVTLFLGLKSKLKSALVEQITTLPFEVRLVKIRMTKKNALDFVLTYHLGEMLARYPRGHYYIVSGDKKDFEPLVTYLQDNHVHVSRHEDIASLPFLQPHKAAAPATSAIPAKPAAHPKPMPTTKAVDPKPKPPEDRLVKLIARLRNPSASRPKNKARLLAHIKTAYGQKLTDDVSAQKLEELVHRGVLVIEDKDKVRYL